MWLLSDGKPGSSILLSPYCPTIHLSKTLLLVPHLMAKEMTNFRDHQCFFIRCDYLIRSSFSEVKIQKQEITENRFRKYYVPIPQKRKISKEGRNYLAVEYLTDISVSFKEYILMWGNTQV